MTKEEKILALPIADKLKLEMIQEYRQQQYELLKPENRRGILPNQALPKGDVDPEHEWVFPGHAAPNHPARVDKPDPATGVRNHHKIKMEKNAGEKRRLFRQWHYEDYLGKRRVCYKLCHCGGHYTDVWITYDARHWSEAEAKEFHAARVAHPGWTPQKPTLTEFNRRVLQQVQSHAVEVTPRAVPRIANIGAIANAKTEAELMTILQGKS